MEDATEAKAAAKATGQKDKYVIETRYGPLSQVAVLKTRHAANANISVRSHAIAAPVDDSDSDSDSDDQVSGCE